MLPDISVYPAHTCIRKHYESEAYNMELFDILQTAEEVSGIDMKAVLQAMGISVNVKEQEIAVFPTAKDEPKKINRKEYTQVDFFMLS